MSLDRELSSYKERGRPEVLVRELSNLLLNGEFEELFHRTSKLDEAKGVQKRILLHFTGMAHVYTGALNKAKLIFIKALQDEGNYIGILNDLACVYYQLGEIDQWRSTYTQISRELTQCEALLSVNTRTSTSLILAKFLEEEGQVAKALERYESSYRDALTLKGQSELYLQCLAQILRLKALYRNGTNLGSLYTELISLRPQSITRDLHFEVQHGLMLAEMALVGVEHAWVRVESCLKDPHVSPQDKRLIFFDFVEELVVCGLPLPADLASHVPDMTDADCFEEEVHRLVFAEQGKRQLLSLTQLAAELSWACYLRLLILYLSVEKSPEKAEELKNKINLILGALDPESRPFWLNRMRPYLASTDLVIQFSMQSRKVAYQNKQLDLSRKRGMLMILEALSQSSTLSVDSVITRIWNSSYSPEYYHRLRMTIHRLNQLLFELTAIPKIVEINAETVSVKPSVQLSAEKLSGNGSH